MTGMIRRTTLIARREVFGLFTTPTGYLVAVIFAVLVNGWFIAGFGAGEPATLRSLFITLVGLLIFIVPAISMRLLSEELRSRTVELMMTAPVTDTEVVVGKWLGGLIFYLTMLLPVLVVILVLEYTADPDYGPILTGLLGLVLVGALYLAIGVCVSAACESQVTAYLVTALITGFLTYGLFALYSAQGVPNWIKPALLYLNVDYQYADFAKGLIDVRHLIYFVSLTVMFLFFGVRLLESRRWR